MIDWLQNDYNKLKLKPMGICVD